ncbi:TetR/AcrR family transcriptional regulator [Paenibacillus rubinfantis]|uniref:TetR/AcrR family transcriptional regulator n=1 Tax=Paenibacillus rubinfantis TaxID=1720296 RepID=UPI00073F0A58
MYVFGDRGYEGTSLPHLVTGLGIARQSIYDTYGTKWDLFFAAVKHYMDQKNQELQQHREGPGPIADKVELVFTTIIKVLMEVDIRDLARFLVHERIALITSAKLGMDEPQLRGILQMVLRVFRTLKGTNR